MPLMPFSEPMHIPLLIDGEKTQTTRKPRKLRLKVGDTLYCWYRPRLPKNCRNCINNCPNSALEIQETTISPRVVVCSDHDNFFGTAIIIDIKRTKISDMSPADQAAWAIKDGFESYDHAHAWFSKRYGHDWACSMTFDIIQFRPEWV